MHRCLLSENGTPFAALVAAALSSYILTALSFSSFQSALALLNRPRPIRGVCGRGWVWEGLGDRERESVRVGGG